MHGSEDESLPEPEDDGLDGFLQCVAVRGSDTGTLLSAFGLLMADRPGLRLEVLGEGAIADEVHRQAEDLGFEDRLSVRDRLPSAELQRAVSRCTVMVLPDAGAVGTRPAPRRTPAGEVATPHAPPVVLFCPTPFAVMVRRDAVVVGVVPGDVVDLARALADLLDGPPAPASDRSARRPAASPRPRLFG